MNAEELMVIANKRLCGQASKETKDVVRAMCDEVIKTNLEHGFVETSPNQGICCSNCRQGFKKSELKIRNFCPNCGAFMRGDKT